MSSPFNFKELRKPQRSPNARCCICRKKSHTAGECPDRKLPPMKVMYSFDLTKD
jgi:hypothetical protein